MKAFIFCLLIIFQGCSHSFHYQINKDPNRITPQVEKVHIFPDELPRSSSSKVLGLINAASKKNKKDLLEEVKLQARKLGASQVYEFKVEYLSSYGSWISASGVAIE